MRRGRVFFNNINAGIISEDADGYLFSYDEQYLHSENARAVSFTLPLRSEPYRDRNLFPFFDGLIPEGWLLEIAEKNWKLTARDRMGLLLACCRDCIGAVSVIELTEENDE